MPANAVEQVTMQPHISCSLLCGCFDTFVGLLIFAPGGLKLNGTATRDRTISEQLSGQSERELVTVEPF